MCGENIVGEGIYGERQLLSAGDDFFWCLTAEVAIPEWNPPFKQSGYAPVYPYPEIGNDCSIRVF